jgi:hypothetical protein
MPSSATFPEEKTSSLRPLLEPINSMAARLGIGLTKAWELVRDRRVEVVYLDGRTLVVVASTDRFAAQLREEASSREPSDWSRRCGRLASAANKGRQRPRAENRAQVTKRELSRS